jgi:hypothetical protein
LWTRGENLTQAHPKQCPVAGKEILCNKPPASNDPESGNPEEGTLLKVNPYNNWGASTQHSSNKPTPQREEAELVPKYKPAYSNNKLPQEDSRSCPEANHKSQENPSNNQLTTQSTRPNRTCSFKKHNM